MTRKSERAFAVACVLLGPAVSALLAPKNPYFIANFCFFALPQFCVIALVSVVAPRAAFVTGAALALIVHLLIFWVSLSMLIRPDGLAWLLYLFTLPGALLVPFAVSLWLLRGQEPTPQRAGLLAAGSVGLGVALTVAVIYAGAALQRHGG
jgi:hypothetical protein